MKRFGFWTPCRPTNFARATGRRAKRPWANRPDKTEKGFQSVQAICMGPGSPFVTVVRRKMIEIEKLREQIPDAARDIRLNLQTVFQSTTLTPAQTWGAALASAFATRNGELARAVFAEAQKTVEANVIEDARAAAALMAMNNVYRS